MHPCLNRSSFGFCLDVSQEGDGVFIYVSQFVSRVPEKRNLEFSSCLTVL